jgi:uncharacterized protein YcnI
MKIFTGGPNRFDRTSFSGTFTTSTTTFITNAHDCNASTQLSVFIQRSIGFMRIQFDSGWKVFLKKKMQKKKNEKE